MAKKDKKEEVVILDAEIIEEISEPDYDLKDTNKSRKNPRGTRKKDFPEFTVERREQLLQIMSMGTPTNIAAKMAGIHPSTLDRWMDKGAEATQRLEDGEELYPVEKDFADFYIRCNQVTANAVASLLGVLMRKSQTNPYIALKLIEKLDPENFGAKTELKMTGEMTKTNIDIKIDAGEVAKNLSTKELRQLREEFAKRKTKQLEANTVTDDDDED